jgi:hypothetical protein
VRRRREHIQFHHRVIKQMRKFALALVFAAIPLAAYAQFNPNVTPNPIDNMVAPSFTQGFGIGDIGPGSTFTNSPFSQSAADPYAADPSAIDPVPAMPVPLPAIPNATDNGGE